MQFLNKKNLLYKILYRYLKIVKNIDNFKYLFIYLIII